jgi:hypothetical protein
MILAANRADRTAALDIPFLIGLLIALAVSAVVPMDAFHN